jgi:hypothetical protein
MSGSNQLNVAALAANSIVATPALLTPFLLLPVICTKEQQHKDRHEKSAPLQAVAV